MQKRIGLILLFVCIATIMIAGCTSQPSPAAVTTTAATPAATIAAPVSTVKEKAATIAAPVSTVKEKAATIAAPVSTVKEKAATIAAPVSTVKENTDKTTLGETNAALKAKQYLRTMAFSRKGLIEQLEYEGFTPQQAEYGVQAVGY
jgi:outer membrane murein-binding lipoprotein Lpp